jgi:hypothetical protein
MYVGLAIGSRCLYVPSCPSWNPNSKKKAMQEKAMIFFLHGNKASCLRGFAVNLAQMSHRLCVHGWLLSALILC